MRAATLEHYQPAARLAELASLPIPEKDLLPLLRNLVDRGILESATGRGFRLKSPPLGQELPSFCGHGPEGH